MKKFILATVVTLTAQMSFANCDATSTYYASEGDDVGVELPLKLSCDSANDQLCVYVANGVAKITGASVSGNELTRQNISKSGSDLSISLKTSLAGSILDYRYINLELNLISMKGVLTSGGHGVSPYDGVIKRPEQRLEVQCSKN